MWRVYLRRHDGGEVTDKTVTADMTAAEAAYRALLARDDLAGEPVAAVVSAATGSRSGGGKSIYFSRFDRPFGGGRIHPAAPLDLCRQDDGTSEASRWVPPAESHDWEADPRPFAECLKAWHTRPGWSRDRAAAELRTAPTTYYGWCAGRGCAAEGAMRRLMTLIDKVSAAA